VFEPAPLVANAADNGTVEEPLEIVADELVA